MGADISCECLKQAIVSSTLLVETEHERSSRDRLSKLQSGARFMRSQYLGMSSQELIVNISEDTSLLEWKTVNAGLISGKIEHGQIDLTSEVSSIQSTGAQGMSIIGIEGKSIFEVQAEDGKIRDLWVSGIEQLLTNWESNPSSKPRSSLSAAGTSNKAEYFKKREAELAEREKQNALRKAKYSSGGMKYVAMAMANRE